MSTTVIGVQELFYALILTEDETTTTYESPKRLGYVQELTITPSTESASQYGDNRVIETYTSLGAIEVGVTLTGIEPEIEAEVLGHAYIDGATVKTAIDQAPRVALLYKRLMADGLFRYKVLYRGQFALPEEANNTKEDTVTFQSTSLTASFIPRLSDQVFEYQVDERVAEGDAVVQITEWFTEVQEPLIDENITP